MLLSRFRQRLVSFVFQPTCCCCNNEITTEIDDDDPTKSVICDRCFGEIFDANMDRCYFCGTGISPLNPFGSRCSACRSWKSKFERVVAIGNYHERLRQIIVEIKRSANETKAYQLGVLLGHVCDRYDLLPEIDVVVPVPSHWRRRWTRKGLHVADIIAQGFCSTTGHPKVQNVLKCRRHTKKQSKLRPGQRIKNVKNAFELVQKHQIAKARVLLLDDVMTSGATVNECTNLLLNSGVRSVFVAVAARASGVS